MRFFFFGTLMDRDLLAVVTGRDVAAVALRPARLSGYRRVRVVDETFPMLLPSAAHEVEGRLAEGLDPADIERILFFESIEYAYDDVHVCLAGGERLAAKAFLATGVSAHVDLDWDYAHWQAHDKTQALRETEIWMGFYGHVHHAEAERLWDQAVAAGQPLEDLLREVQDATAARLRKRRAAAY